MSTVLGASVRVVSLRAGNWQQAGRPRLPVRTQRAVYKPKTKTGFCGIVRAATETEKEEKKDAKVGEITKSLKESGVTRESAQEILTAWSDKVGHEISPDELRKILVGQSTRALALVFISTLLDAGAAYGAFVAGNFLGLGVEKYGVIAVIGQALAYAAAGGYLFQLFC